MKKILILCNSDSGLYNFRKELLEELIKENYEVYVSVPIRNRESQLTDMGCKVIDTSIDRRGKNPLADIRLIGTYLKIIKKIKPDLAITYTIKPNIYGGIICRLLKIPYIINITGLGSTFQREGIFKRLIIAMYKAAVKRASCTLFENSNNRNIFINNRILQESKTFLLNGAGVNLERYSFEELPDISLIRFIFIGRIMREKGIDELFYAAKRIKSEYNNVEFEVIGSFEEGYQKRVRELEEKNIISFHGVQGNVKPFIKNAHCLILPSYHEGMSNVLLEAAAMGRPIITSNIHGCMEAVNNEKNGFLCNVKDRESLYQKITKFIKLPMENKKEMGMESRKHMENVFDRRNVVNETMSIISKALNEKT